MSCVYALCIRITPEIFRTAVPFLRVGVVIHEYPELVARRPPCIPDYATLGILRLSHA